MPIIGKENFWKYVNFKDLEQKKVGFFIWTWDAYILIHQQELEELYLMDIREEDALELFLMSYLIFSETKLKGNKLCKRGVNNIKILFKNELCN